MSHDTAASNSPESSGRFRRAPATTLFDYHGRILLAEDDDDTRDALASALEMDGHQVVQVADGQHLLEALSSESWPPHRGRPFDLLITDLRMPGWSGLQSIARLRRSYWRTPVIAITAFSNDEMSQEAESSAAVLFKKPFDLDDLRTAVFFLLRKNDLQ
jgi:DNA-binding response OmpR family regulator